MRRLLLIVLGLAGLVLIPWLIWGPQIEQWAKPTVLAEWIRARGPWGWATVVGLLCADSVLPLPSTTIMAVSGYVYGPWVGGVVSALGSFTAGAIAYLLCRLLGQRAAGWLAGNEALAQGERLLRGRGAWLVTLSRTMPILPEVIACLAGLVRMPAPIFFLALACGALPTGFVYAWVGATGQKNPGLALALSAVIPVVLWFFAKRWQEARGEQVKPG